MLLTTEVVVFTGLFFTDCSSLEKITICPGHRDLYGVRWRRTKRTCEMPYSLNRHKKEKKRADRTMQESVIQAFKKFIS